MGSARRSGRRRTGSGRGNAILRRTGRAIARCSPGCDPSVSFACIGIESTGSYGAGLLRFMQQAGIAVSRGHDARQAGSPPAWKERRSRRPERGPCRLCRPADVTPRSRDGMIRSLRVLMACRKTAVSARRVALQMIHNTIVCAPDGLRDQLHRPHPGCNSSERWARGSPICAYRDLESAYRIGLKSLARRYLELHDEIADLDAMIAAIVEELVAEPHCPQFDWPCRSCPAHSNGRRQLKIAVGGSQLRIPVRRQSCSGVVGKDR